MKKLSISKGNPKHGKIGTAKVYSRIKILIAGALMGIAAIYYPTGKEFGAILALAAALVFVWDIVRQTQSAIDTEKRIRDLEEKIKKLESKDNHKQD